MVCKAIQNLLALPVKRNKIHIVFYLKSRLRCLSVSKAPLSALLARGHSGCVFAPTGFSLQNLVFQNINTIEKPRIFGALNI